MTERRNSSFLFQVSRSLFDSEEDDEEVDICRSNSSDRGARSVRAAFLLEFDILSVSLQTLFCSFEQSPTVSTLINPFWVKLMKQI